MKRTTILLEDRQAAILEEIAARTGRSFTDLVREAVSEYVERLNAGRPSALPPPQTIPEAEWQDRFAAVLERFRSRVDPAWSQEEAEADITAAREEVRQERTARRTAGS